ncbi:acetyl-CoA carboxylase, carboxyltransferase subunit beta [Enterococcus sp. BWB1-3]|uniref:acetyl-CoA carboxylase, carboxyltransferase subunit beta n=1 Tax=Enterococcus sp. BWB1-3 TaxID=2787713 RepID=UPI001923CC3F|nr:acetyl-CoA carboxylase, carboxyltransferase subunit beta [Enterococcus sp. BWB1-3]MBL1228812.1 acetyl-CoA carboxylase, carboxyltransferase subunit beta [Enterococcus sp. BWB1-3]
MTTYKVKPKKKIYRQLKQRDQTTIIEDCYITCKSCSSCLLQSVYQENHYVCYKCGCHQNIHGRDRIALLCDKGSFLEFNQMFKTKDPLNFDGYNDKLIFDKKKSGLQDAIITGKGKLQGQDCVIAVMESSFRMGSMGVVVGEKIYRAIQTACELELPFVIFTASGGARMQEGMYSLMQMAKTIQAFELLRAKKLLSIVVMTHPTTGGVSASFANVADIIIAEPQATIGFAGRKVIEKTLKEQLPEDFQTAEFLFKHGHVDDIVSRKEQRDYLIKLFQVFGKKGKPSRKGKTFRARAGMPLDKSGSNAKEHLDLVRKMERPNAEDYIQRLFPDFIELHGDRTSADDQAVLTGLAVFHNIPVAVIGQNRGKNYKENSERNFGMASPAGFRKVKRIIELAEKFNCPVLSFVDTKGADPTEKSEKSNQSWAIAQCIQTMLRADIPTLSLVIGEGGSGGALAVSATDKLFMLEKSVYSVISAEGAASILWKDSNLVAKAAESLKITAADLAERKIIDGIIPEITPDASQDIDKQVGVIDTFLFHELSKLLLLDASERMQRRVEKYLSMGTDQVIGGKSEEELIKDVQ